MTAEELFTAYPELVIYDFEVFKGYWLLTLIDKDHPEGQFIETVPALIEAYDTRKSWVWAGYNSGHYDRFILGALYRGNMSKADLYNFSQRLINEGNFKEKWRQLLPDMKSYDVAGYAMVGGKPKYSLKQLEAYMGHSIEESSIPWDYPEAFTKEQKQETRAYCLHDVQETLAVLLLTMADFTAQADLISTFSLGPKAWGMTKAQLTAEVLQCQSSITEVIEEDGVLYDIERPLDFSGEEWSNFILPCVELSQYAAVLDFYSNADNYKSETQKLEIDIMGVPHTLGLGGIHGARRKYHQRGHLMHIDVTSYYPSLMIQWGLLTRRTQHPELFKEIYDKRVALKRAGKKREQAPYKIILNSTFGISNDKHSKAYDPCRNHEVCINGQLMAVMLLEMLEGKCTLIQSNTDGIIVCYEGYSKEDIIATCKEWEALTRMSLDYEEISEIWQKDVNNYLVLYEDGKTEAKGAYVKESGPLDNDLSIIREAVRQGLIQGSADAVRATIEHCVDLAAFQKVFKLSSSYKYAYIGDTPIEGHKCFRLYAVKDGCTLYKQKKEGGTKEKVANTPPSACLVYGDLSNPDLKDSTGQPFGLDRIDREYYIETALKQYREMLPD